MTFAVPADSYDKFMGRYSTLLAPQFADLAGVGSGQRVIDVGCGPGALTTELVERLGASNVAAVDPSESFVAAARERHPGVDVQESPAETLPFADGIFDAALAQLVVHFMADPVQGLSEMGRVTRAGGVVAACVWDHAESRRRLRPSGRPCANSTRTRKAKAPLPAREKVSSRSSSMKRGCVRSRRRRCRFTSTTRPSRNGGIPSHWASGGRGLRGGPRP